VSRNAAKVSQEHVTSLTSRLSNKDEKREGDPTRTINDCQTHSTMQIINTSERHYDQKNAGSRFNKSLEGASSHTDNVDFSMTSN